MLLVSLIAALGACRDGLITAPAGSTIILTASPTQIGANGQAEITALVRDQDGNPVGSSREVTFFTNLGSIDETGVTDRRGIAKVTLRGNGSVGKATVTAVSGGSDQATVDVQIGPVVGTISLSGSPASVSESGGTVNLLAVVRDDGGGPLSSAAVTFSAELGSLRSGGGVVKTNKSGEARDRLTVTSAEAGSATATSFQVTAETTGADGSLMDATFTVTIQQQAPRAAFSATGSGDNKVLFTNDSTGQSPLSFEWDFENDGTTDSTERSPTHDYGTAGTYTVVLRVSNSVGSDSAVQTLTVPLQ